MKKSRKIIVINFLRKKKYFSGKHLCKLKEERGELNKDKNVKVRVHFRRGALPESQPNILVFVK